MKIFDKVKKLLELAASPNEHEAKLAFEKAQEIIAKYSLDMSQSQEPEGIIEKEYKAKISILGLNEFLPEIALAVSKPFGVYVVIKRWSEDRALKINLVGFKTNVEVAEYTLDCILNQCAIDYKEGYKKYRSVVYSQNFWNGVRLALIKRFERDSTNETGLVVYDKVKNYMKKFASASLEYSSVIGAAGKAEGFNSGLTASVRPGVTAQEGGRLLQ